MVKTEHWQGALWPCKLHPVPFSHGSRFASGPGGEGTREGVGINNQVHARFRRLDSCRGSLHVFFNLLGLFVLLRVCLFCTGRNELDAIREPYMNHPLWLPFTGSNQTNLSSQDVHFPFLANIFVRRMTSPAGTNGRRTRRRSICSSWTSARRLRLSQQADRFWLPNSKQRKHKSRPNAT